MTAHFPMKLGVAPIGGGFISQLPIDGPKISGQDIPPSGSLFLWTDSGVPLQTDSGIPIEVSDSSAPAGIQTDAGVQIKTDSGISIQTST